jgi:hypothetical protein
MKVGTTTARAMSQGLKTRGLTVPTEADIAGVPALIAWLAKG